MTRHIPEAVFWSVSAAILVVLLVLLYLLVHEKLVNAALRRRVTDLGEDLRLRDEEVRHLATVRLPSVMETAHVEAMPPAGLLHERLDKTPFGESLHTVADLFARTVDKARARADQSAKSALKASMRALQGLANEQQLAISDMQDRHDNPDVLADLLEIDHTNSQFGRRAQAIAVLCGSWPGRQRVASSLLDVARGATSRIRDYRRIEVHSQVEMAVVSRAVEPVVLTIAELLDNAARHSQPNTRVQVNVQPAHNGAAIVIDDAGVGLHTQQIEQAGRLLAGNRAVDINRLGDPPQFGFAVIGVLAARYGFSVSVDTRSPYGGVRAVLFLPSELLTRVELDEPAPVAAPAVAPRPRTRPSVPEAPQPTPDPMPQSRPAQQAPARQPLPEPGPEPEPEPDPLLPPTVGGLPKRRRRQPLADSAPPAEPEQDVPGRSAQDAAAIMGAFSRGTKSGRASSTDASDSPAPDSPATKEHEGNTDA